MRREEFPLEKVTRKELPKVLQLLGNKKITEQSIIISYLDSKQEELKKILLLSPQHQLR